MSALLTLKFDFFTSDVFTTKSEFSTDSFPSLFVLLSIELFAAQTASCRKLFDSSATAKALGEKDVINREFIAITAMYFECFIIIKWLRYKTPAEYKVHRKELQIYFPFFLVLYILVLICIRVIFRHETSRTFFLND